MIFGVSPMLQKDLVTRICYRACGKIMVAGIDGGHLGPLVPCRERNCPWEEDRMDADAEVFGEPLLLRKLKPERNSDED